MFVSGSISNKSNWYNVFLNLNLKNIQISNSFRQGKGEAPLEGRKAKSKNEKEKRVEQKRKRLNKRKWGEGKRNKKEERKTERKKE